MRKPVESQSEGSAIITEEETVLETVRALISAESGRGSGPAGRADHDAELIALRDQIAEEKPEDLASLVEQMTRVQAIARGRRGKAAVPLDAACPYFAHLRIRARDAEAAQDILIGRRGYIDRSAGVQIVDWRDAPVSQVYYRYDEGDDYEEEVGGRILAGQVLARRNVTIAAGALRRIGCPQGAFVSSIDGSWYELSGQGVALLEGGAGTAARPPRPQAPNRRGAAATGRKPRFETARPARADNKQLPEIAALIDPEQFALITERSRGLVVIQGGAGSGKTTVALHRIAYLLFHDRTLKPSRCLFVVPSEALERYVSGVLPALGVHGVPVVTCRSWARNLRRRLVPEAADRYADETPVGVARLKKHAGLLSLLERAVLGELKGARIELAKRLGGHAASAWVLTAWDATTDLPPLGRVRRVRKLVTERKLDLPPPTAHAAEQALKRVGARLSSVQRILFELLTDRSRLTALESAQHEPARSSEIEELVRWSTAQLEEATPSELEGIDEERLRPIDGLPLDAADGTPDAGARSRLDPEDDALLLRVYQLVHGGFQRVDGAPLEYDHIAIDEAQDLSVAELKVLYEALRREQPSAAGTFDARRSLTIAGDVAQRVVFDNGFRGWAELLGDLAGGAGTQAASLVRPLKLSYRSTAQVMRLANAVLGPLADPELEVTAREGAEVELHRFNGMGEAVGFVAEALRSLTAREPSASVALLARHSGQADAWFAALARAEVPHLRRVRRQDFAFAPGVDVTEVGQVKGLEFDYVILLDVNQSSYPATLEARHLLHIGATRATHQLWLVATDTVSELIPNTLRQEDYSDAQRAG